MTKKVLPTEAETQEPVEEGQEKDMGARETEAQEKENPDTDEKDTENQEVPEEETETDTPEKSAAQEKPLPEARSRLIERIRQSLPDQKLEEEDACLEAAIAHIDQLETYQKANNEANQKVIEVFQQQPEISAILSDMVQGASFPEALARNIDIDALEPAKGDPDYNKWAQAKADRQKRIEKAQAYEKRLTDNRKVSIENVVTFQKEKGLSDDERTRFTTQINTVLTDVLEEGKITPEFLDVMYKGLAFQEAIDTARKQGEIRGKNEAIDQKKVRKATQDDGIPTIQSQAPVKPRKPDPITSGLEHYNRNFRRFGNQ